MNYETLCLVWFILLGVLLGGYAVLDGFDLGVGIVHLFLPRTDHERRLALNTIGPIWDGNEVWLVTFGGAMFAMFPLAYKSIFSGFYSAFMLLLLMLISRAVSIEFRSKMEHASWRHFWDTMFSIGSAGATLLFGVAVGNAVRGVVVDGYGDLPGGLLSQLNPYAVLVGLLTVAMFAMHGAIYLYLKTHGEFQERIHRAIWRLFAVFVMLFIAVTIYTALTVPRATAAFENHPWMWLIPVLNILSIANIPRALYRGWPRYAFISSSCTILALVFLLGAALFPNMVAGAEPGTSITIYHAASSVKTLEIGLLIVAIGMPCVLAYTIIVYWTFRGKVELGPHSY